MKNNHEYYIVHTYLIPASFIPYVDRRQTRRQVRTYWYVRVPVTTIIIVGCAVWYCCTFVSGGEGGEGVGVAAYVWRTCVRMAYVRTWSNCKSCTSILRTIFYVVPSGIPFFRQQFHHYSSLSEMSPGPVTSSFRWSRTAHGWMRAPLLGRGCC